MVLRLRRHEVVKESQALRRRREVMLERLMLEKLVHHLDVLVTTDIFATS